MRRTLTIAFLLLVCCANFAQMTSPIRIKAGEDIQQKLAHEIYLYPVFTKGIIAFRDGKMSQSNFNYNFLNGEMQFVDAKGDTLSLANELTIKYISIEKDSFFYDSGYLQLIAENEFAKLARKQLIRIVDQQKIGAYDQPSSAGSITSYNMLTNSSLKTIKLDVRQDVIMAKQTNFFFSDQYNNFQKANKKNLLKAFHKKETELNDYFKSNNVDFYKEEDLIKLLAVLKN